MLLTLGVIICAILTCVVTVRAMRDQRSKGKGAITSFIVGCFTGGFTGAFLLVMLGIASLFFIGSDSKIEEVEAAEPATVASSDRGSKIEAGSDLGFDAKTFASRFNAAMADLNQPYRAEGNVDNSGVQGVFQEAFSEHLALTGTVKPESGAVNGIIFMGTGDGTPESGARVMVVASGLVAATQDSMSPHDAFEVVMSLVQSYDGGDSASQTLNGVKYSYQRSDMFGNMLTVDSADT